MDLKEALEVVQQLAVDNALDSAKVELDLQSEVLRQDMALEMVQAHIATMQEKPESESMSGQTITVENVDFDLLRKQAHVLDNNLLRRKGQFKGLKEGHRDIPSKTEVDDALEGVTNLLSAMLNPPPKPPEDPRFERLRKGARDNYAVEGIVDIDNGAEVSVGENGRAFVAAWVCLRAEDADYSVCDTCETWFDSKPGDTDAYPLCETCEKEE